jgi:hypothetical protein
LGLKWGELVIEDPHGFSDDRLHIGSQDVALSRRRFNLKRIDVKADHGSLFVPSWHGMP